MISIADGDPFADMPLQTLAEPEQVKKRILRGEWCKDTPPCPSAFGGSSGGVSPLPSFAAAD